LSLARRSERAGAPVFCVLVSDCSYVQGKQTHDFSAAKTNSDIGDGDIFSLTRSVGNHKTPPSTESILGSLNRFADGSDLVDLEQQSVASLGLDGLLDEHRVGHGQIVTVS